MIVHGHYRSPWYLDTWIDLYRAYRMRRIDRIRAEAVAKLKADGRWPA